MELLNTLYVTTPDSYLHLDNQTLCLRLEDKPAARMPLHHLQSVVCFGRINFSTPLIHHLADVGISFVMLDENGRFKARIEGPISGNVLLRKAQFRQLDNASFGLQIAKGFVAGKIRNTRQLLLRAARETQNLEDRTVLVAGSNHLASSLRRIRAMETLDQLRGVEGDAAQVYFSCFNHLIRSESRKVFTFEGRNRRPPRDPTNALLSFFYAMLMNDCRSAIEATGLDPQVGFLHVLRPGKAALALDLMEEFRHIAERLTLSLINRGQLKKGDFDFCEGGAVLLKGEGRKTAIMAYQERKRELIVHPLLSEKIPIGVAFLIQARLIARVIRGDMPQYVPFLIR